MKHYFKIFAFILALSYITAQESQTTLAVLDFEPRGINTLEAATLTDRFTSEIGKTEVMVLVDRTMVEEILKEQGFVKTRKMVLLKWNASVTSWGMSRIGIRNEPPTIYNRQ